MTKPVWSHVLALNAWTLKKAHIVSALKCIKNYKDRFSFKAEKS